MKERNVMTIEITKDRADNIGFNIVINNVHRNMFVFGDDVAATLEDSERLSIPFAADLIEAVRKQEEVPLFAIEVKGDKKYTVEWFEQAFLPQYKYLEFTINSPEDVLRQPEWVETKGYLSCDKKGFTYETWCPIRGRYGKTLRYKPTSGEFYIVDKPYFNIDF